MQTSCNKHELKLMTGFRTLDRFRGQSQPKISVSVSLQKTTYPNQFSMRNTNLESKIARHQLFDLKVTFWPDMPKYRVKINVTFSLHKPTYPGQFFMRNSNLELKIAWDQLFDLKVTFWPDLSKCRVKINVAFSLQKNNLSGPVFHEEFESEIENSEGSIIWPESDLLTWHTYIRSGQYPVKMYVFFLLQNKPTRPSFAWGIRIWNIKQHGIYYLTLKWPFDLI